MNNKFTAAVALIQEIRDGVNRNASALARVIEQNDALAARLEANTLRLLRAIKDKHEKSIDIRSREERRLIDHAALTYVRRIYLQGVRITRKACFSHIWKNRANKNLYENFTKFYNAVNYDLANFYDQDVLLARARAFPE